MFSSFSRSWELVKASWAVLRADKELIVFPIVSMIGMIIVTIAFIIPSIAAGVFELSHLRSRQWKRRSQPDRRVPVLRGDLLGDLFRQYSAGWRGHDALAR